MQEYIFKLKKTFRNIDYTWCHSQLREVGKHEVQYRHSLKMLEIELPHKTAIELLGIYWKESREDDIEDLTFPC